MLSVEQSSIINISSKGKVDLVVESDKDVYGIQFDLKYNPAELTFNGAESTNDFTFEYSQKEDGTVRGLMFSMNGEKLNASDLASLIALDFSSHFQKKVEKLILIGTTYKRSDEERSLVLDRYNQAKLNKPISKQALKRWFSDKYLENNPQTYDLFMKILNKELNNNKNFLKAYKLFANHYDDFEAIKKINIKTLVMTGSDDVGSTPAMSKELVKDLANSTYIEIQNGKHLCSIECADDVNMNIKNFINN